MKERGGWDGGSVHMGERASMLMLTCEESHWVRGIIYNVNFSKLSLGWVLMEIHAPEEHLKKCHLHPSLLLALKPRGSRGSWSFPKRKSEWGIKPCTALS